MDGAGEASAWTVFHAVEHGNVEQLRRALLEVAADVNSRTETDIQHFTRLLVAVEWW